MPFSFVCCIDLNCRIIFATLVEAGNAKSVTDVRLSSASFLKLFLPAAGSEHIHMACISSSASECHSLSVCPNNAIEGTKNNIKPLPLVSFSAIFNEVNVFPVPQAMISLPLSLLLKYS